MGLIYDNSDQAAMTLTRFAAEESVGPGALERRMLDYLGSLEQCNGAPILELVAITIARVHFKSLDTLARATGDGSAAFAGRSRRRGAGRPRRRQLNRRPGPGCRRALSRR